MPSRGRMVTGYLAGVLVVVCVSLVAVGTVYAFQGFALGVGVFVAMVAMAIWRPRYGLYAILLLAVTFDPYRDDPFMYAGWLAQTPISAATPLQLVIVSPIEFLLIITALVVVLGSLVRRQSLRPAQLQPLLLLFLVMIVFSIGWGLAGGGTFNIALWETRSLMASIIVAFLVPNLLSRREHVHHLINLMCLGILLLSLDIIWRRFTILSDTTYLDLSFDHNTPILMNIVVVLFVARLVWPATGRQRLVALFIPLILYAEMVTERRAGWVSLDIGLILVAIFVFRLRRKTFYFVVLPLLLVYTAYLGAFWNAQGPLAQPARAVRSINDPEGRDMQSNIARVLERMNVRTNIQAHPVTGLGFGQPYVFYYPMPDMSWWPLWRYVAHAQFLWLWMKMGPLGFITFLTLIGAATVRGIHLLKRAANDRSAPYLVAIVSGLLMLIVYSYVDIAFNSIRTTALLGFFIGVIGTWGRDAACQESN